MDSKIDIKAEVLTCDVCGHTYLAFAKHSCDVCGDCVPFCLCSDEDRLA